MVYQATRPTKVAIGERRRPEPGGRPGYLRVDTVHQGDLEGVKGVYHINAVDEVTQWQVVGATEQISEAYLLPVLEAMLAQFPFGIRVDHAAFVGVGQSAGDFDRHAQQLRIGHRPLLEPLGQGLPLEVFHDQVIDALVVADIVQGAGAIDSFSAMS